MISWRRPENRPMWVDGKRIGLRPLEADDFEQYREVRAANVDWLTPWEPRQPPGSPNPGTDRMAFLTRCDARRNDRQSGRGFAFGVFKDANLIGEMNLSSVNRGAAQSAYIGYWVDHRQAGNSYTPEALVALLQFAFETINLHRVQAAIVPRNMASRRVVEKIEMRFEGVAERYLQINGVWEDHRRYAMTVEEWEVRSEQLSREWLQP